MKIKTIEYLKLDAREFGYWHNRALEELKKELGLNHHFDICSKDYLTLFQVVERLHQLCKEGMERPDIYLVEDFKSLTDKRFQAEYCGESVFSELDKGSLSILAKTPVRYREMKNVEKIHTIEVDGVSYSRTETSQEYGEWVFSEEHVTYYINKFELQLLEE
jgi:hypothetical protein